MITGLIQTTAKPSAKPSAKPDERVFDQRSDGLSVDSPPRGYDTPIRGHLDHQGAETNYRGATHWASILENVSASPA